MAPASTTAKAAEGKRACALKIKSTFSRNLALVGIAGVLQGLKLVWDWI
jgi:hypothetical protein